MKQAVQGGEAEASELEQTPEQEEPIEFEGFQQFTTISLGSSIDDALDTLGRPTSTTTMDIMGAESTTKTWLTINLFRLSTTEAVTFTKWLCYINYVYR